MTIGDETFPLPEPFLVLATQNPIEQEGTYPLPEAQVDRFMLKLPSATRRARRSGRSSIAWRTSTRRRPFAGRRPGRRCFAFAALVDDIYVDDKIKDYIIDLVLATRDPELFGLDARRRSSNTAPRRARRCI